MAPPKNELRSRSNKKPNKKQQGEAHKVTQSQADLAKVK
jgi:hypothetical protein